MDQNKRKALLTAVELGNLTRAAETLGYTQSGLSYLIKSLEQELGFPLLVRSRTGVRPTADCLTVLPYLRELERKTQQLEQVSADIRGLVTGAVSIGVFPCISRFWLPRILQDFNAKYPGISVHILESGQDDLDQWLLDGSIDLAFCSRGPTDVAQWVQFTQDGIFAVVPSRHPLASREEICLSELDGEPFIREASYDYDIPILMEQAGFQPNIRWSSKDELAILALVGAGLGVTIMPGLYLQEELPGIKVLPLIPRAYRQMGAYVPRGEDLSPAAKRFLESARITMGVK